MIWILLTLGILVVGTLLGLCLKNRFPKTGKTVLAVTLVLIAAVILVAAICWDAPDTDWK